MQVMTRSTSGTRATLTGVRVVGGRVRGRRLTAPRGDATRPTSDFVREAIFNALQAIVDWEGVRVADLFAGTGALGIEALSRGAASCVFVDNDRRAADAIRANVAGTGFSDAAHVVVRDVMEWLAAAPPFDVVFTDPPYAFDRWVQVGGIRASLVVAESDRDVDLGPGWVILRTKRYGSTVVTLFEPRSEAL